MTIDWLELEKMDLLFLPWLSTEKTSSCHSHVNTTLWLDSSSGINHRVLVWRRAQHCRNKEAAPLNVNNLPCFTTIQKARPILQADLWTWGRTHKDCRGWAPACERTAHRHKRWAQWGKRTREGFLPPAQAVDAAAAALAPAALRPRPVHSLPELISSRENSAPPDPKGANSQLLRAMTRYCENKQLLKNSQLTYCGFLDSFLRFFVTDADAFHLLICFQAQF